MGNELSFADYRYLFAFRSMLFNRWLRSSVWSLIYYRNHYGALGMSSSLSFYRHVNQVTCLVTLAIRRFYKVYEGRHLS